MPPSSRTNVCRNRHREVRRVRRRRQNDPVNRFEQRTRSDPARDWRKAPGPRPSLRGAKRRGNPAFSCTTNWIASLPLAMTTPRHRERTCAATVIANEREAIQLTPAISLPSQPPLANHQLDCVAPARNDGAVIANEREAIQLETGEKLRVPNRHCEERSDAAIQPLPAPPTGLLRFRSQ
jgi:hypothetical protein